MPYEVHSPSAYRVAGSDLWVIRGMTDWGVLLAPAAPGARPSEVTVGSREHCFVLVREVVEATPEQVLATPAPA